MLGYIDGFNLRRARDSFSFKDNVLAVLMELKKIFIKDNLKVKINGKIYNVVRKTWYEPLCY